MKGNDKCRQDMDFFIDVFREVVKIDEFDIVNKIMKYPDVYEVAKDVSKEDFIEYICSCYPTDEYAGFLDIFFIDTIRDAFLQEVTVWSDDDENEYIKSCILEEYYCRAGAIREAVGERWDDMIIEPDDYLNRNISFTTTLEDVGVTTWDVIVDGEYYKIEFLNK